jgi:hypothetical protein
MDAHSINMEQAGEPRRLPFLIFWGLVWGLSTSGAIAIINRFSTGYFESTRNIVGRTLVFVVGGIVAGELKWRQVASGKTQGFTFRSKTWRITLFVILMLCLAYVVYRMRSG